MIIFRRIHGRIACIGKTFCSATLLITKIRDFTIGKKLAKRIHHKTKFSNFLNTYQVLRSDKLLFTRSAFEKLEERLQK